MISKKIQTAINKQINMEFYSAYLYLSISAYFDSIHRTGFANWMKLQAQEELSHGMKIYDYLLDQEGEVGLATVKAPPAMWKSPLAACQDALKHERANTKMINELVTLASSENDHATRIFMQWFVEEQVEEVATASTLVEKVRLAKDDSGAFFILDNELGQRQLTE